MKGAEKSQGDVRHCRTTLMREPGHAGDANTPGNAVLRLKAQTAGAGYI